MTLINKLLDLLYPQQTRCMNCGSELFAEEIKGLCSSCLEKIELVANYCNVCGRELNKGSTEQVCDICKTRPPVFDRARSIAIYSSVIRNLILKFKYDSEKNLRIPLGELLALYYAEYYGHEQIDFLIPIPLHSSRQEERGYNQSALLAEYLGKHLHIPLLADCLIRDRASQPLYNLGYAERYHTIKNVFSLYHKERLKCKNILLVDDIFTTGATVDETSLQLKKFGKARQVYVLTVATAKIV